MGAGSKQQRKGGDPGPVQVPGGDGARRSAGGGTGVIVRGGWTAMQGASSRQPAAAGATPATLGPSSSSSSSSSSRGSNSSSSSSSSTLTATRTPSPLLAASPASASPPLPQPLLPGGRSRLSTTLWGAWRQRAAYTVPKAPVRIGVGSGNSGLWYYIMSVATSCCV